MAAQSALGQVRFGNGIGSIAFQYLDEGAHRALGLLPFERLGAVQGGLGDDMRVAVVGAGFGFQGLEAALAVLALPAAQRGRPNPTPAATGNLMLCSNSRQRSDVLSDVRRLSMGRIYTAVAVAMDGLNATR